MKKIDRIYERLREIDFYLNRLHWRCAGDKQLSVATERLGDLLSAVEDLEDGPGGEVTSGGLNGK